MQTLVGLFCRSSRMMVGGGLVTAASAPLISIFLRPLLKLIVGRTIAISKTIIVKEYCPAKGGGRALEAVLIFGRLFGANLDNHFDFPPDESSLSEVLFSIGDVISEVDSILSLGSFGSWLSEVMS